MLVRRLSDQMQVAGRDDTTGPVGAVEICAERRDAIATIRMQVDQRLCPVRANHNIARNF